MTNEQGGVWFVELEESAGKRPFIVITRQAVIAHLNKVTSAEITTKGKGYPTAIFIDCNGNPPGPSFVQTDHLHTVSKPMLVIFSGF